VVLARRDANAWAITATNNDDAPRTLTIALPDGAPASGWQDVLAKAPAGVDALARTMTLVVPPRFGTVVAAGTTATPKR
jgi:hypothetical protein